ncbi:MAG: response regulator [Clostridia bacterium]|nr:response regulator [Clostridia bacterium]
MKAIIVDDESPNIEEIDEILKTTGDFDVVGKYTSPSRAISEIEALSPDCAFLDIEMPGINGMELADKLLEINPGIEIVFVTAYNNYATQAFEVNALDYVLKPIDPQRIYKTISRIKQKINMRKKEQTLKITVRMLGNFEIFINEEPVRWSRSKAKELAAYLFYHREQPVNKYKICEDLWPELDAKRALAILQTTICSVRKSISISGRDRIKIQYINEAYMLTSQNVFIDIESFNLMFESFIKGGDLLKAESAVELYNADLLENEGYLWAEEQKQSICKKHSMLLKKLSHSYYEKNEYNRSIEVILKLAKKYYPSEEYQLMFFEASYRLEGTKKLKKHLSALESLLKKEHGSSLHPKVLEAIRNKLGV